MPTDLLRRVSSRWPAIRAVLIAVAIVVSLFSGCPVPRVSRATLAIPVNRHELERWAERLDTPPDDLGRRLISVSETLGRTHAAMMRPFDWWFDLTQAPQRRGLFPIATPDPVWS